MKGKNGMNLNQATVIAIIQHYFDTVLFRDGQSPKITDFRYDGHENLLRLTIMPPETTTAKAEEVTP